MPVNSKHTNIGPRLTIVDKKGGVIARLGGEHGPARAGTFLSPHGLAVDAGRHLCRRGELHQLAGTHPDVPVPKFLRSLQKLERLRDGGKGSPPPDRQRSLDNSEQVFRRLSRRTRSVSSLHAGRRPRAFPLGLFSAPDAAGPSRHGDRSDGAALQVHPVGRQGGARDRTAALQAGPRSSHGLFETGYDKAALASWQIFKSCATPARSPGTSASRSACRRRRQGYLYVSGRGPRDLFRLSTSAPEDGAWPTSRRRSRHADLSIQWDVCQEVLAFEDYFKDRPAHYKRRLRHEGAWVMRCRKASRWAITSATARRATSIWCSRRIPPSWSR